MSIAPRVKSLTQQLDKARQQYRQGHLELARLQTLDHQVTELLVESRNTHFESGLLCMHAVVRSLETLALHRARMSERLTPQSMPQSEALVSHSLAVA